MNANYSYLSDGTKASVLNASGAGYDYNGIFTYSHASGGARTLESVAFGGGRIRKNGSTYAVDYYVTDHLGSVRAIVNASGTIVEQNDFYPFGTRQQNGLTTLSANRWRFSGKEGYDGAFGIALDDFGARRYDRTAWTSIDPLAEKYYNVSPYAYCAGNPVSFVDPDGMEQSTHTDENGYVVATYDDGDLGIYKHQGVLEEAQEEVYRNYSSQNTSAKGLRVGKSLHANSFLKGYSGNSEEIGWIKIDFGSTELSEIVSEIINSDPSILLYIKQAQGGGVWDIKTRIDNGSILFGNTYASPRDAGNFTAGMFAESQGSLSELIMYGYGAYNLCGNSKLKTGAFVLQNCISPTIISHAMYEHARYYGEHPLSRLTQELGRKYYGHEN